MIVNFQINYHTQWGQRLFVCGSLPEMGSWDTQKASKMEYKNDGNWELNLNIPIDKPITLQYKYYILHEQDNYIEWEWGDNRNIEINPYYQVSAIQDFWRSTNDPENVLFSSAFTNVLMHRSTQKVAKKSLSGNVHYRFNLYAPRIDSEHCFCIIGSSKSLGNWDEKKAVIMDETNYPIWHADISPDNDKDLEIAYKYGIYNIKQKQIVTWEVGNNRIVWGYGSTNTKTKIIQNDVKFRYPVGNWKGAGLAVPVFSLKSESGFGVGEFNDIPMLVDWAKKTGLKLIQILPLNDTMTYESNTASPYTPISVFALHPIYIHLESIPSCDNEILKRIKDEKIRLNKSEVFNYPDVIKTKLDFLREIYTKNKYEFEFDPDYKVFFQDNKEWLIPYAAFCVLRNINRTDDFHEWRTHSVYVREEILNFVAPGSKYYSEVAFCYFVQFYLHQQLLKVSDYARKQGVVLKGDLQIGVRGNAVDTWAFPEFFNANTQAGAPPDAFSAEGQNWGFKTYNWDQMAKDNYSWWKARLKKMSEYFDAYRIDHILGFFRIWEIPGDSVQGLMGIFNPSMPISREEFMSWDIKFDYDRFCKPYIRTHILKELFGDDTQTVIKDFLEEYQPDCFNMKPLFATQKQIQKYFKKVPPNSLRNKKIEAGLYKLISDVLFLEAPFSNRSGFHPRIAVQSTYSYKELDEVTKYKVNMLYIDYFYKRHESFWGHHGFNRLTALRAASNMMVCGEDLGMVPDVVPKVMNEVGILGLSIQRMPKVNTKVFANPSDCSYLTVCSTSSHDMASLRGWWETDHDVSQKFYNNELGYSDIKPYFCETWVVRDILNQHLYSPCMWAIFPIQDLFAITNDLREKVPSKERINDPSNGEISWQYRMKINLEDLIKQDNFNDLIFGMIRDSGRYSKY